MTGVQTCALPIWRVIAECEQVKSERETEQINEQVLMAMSEMGLDRERTLQVGQGLHTHTHTHTLCLCLRVSLVKAPASPRDV